MTRDDWRLAPAAVLLFILPFTHTVALRLLALFSAFGIALWVGWRFDRSVLRLPAPLWPWIAFWAVVPLVLLPFSIDWRYSIGEFKSEIMYGLLALVSLFALVRTPRALRIALYALLASYVVLNAWAVVSYIDLGFWKDASRFGGTGTFAAYLLTALPLMVLVHELRLLGARTREAIVLLVALGLITATLTAQRTVLIGVLAQFLVLVTVLRFRGVWPISGQRFGVVIAVAIAAGLAVALAGVAQRFGPDASIASLIAGDPRLNNWGNVIAWTGERWASGYGFGIGTMKRAFPEMWGRSDLFWHAHNLFLNYAFQLGVLGLVSVLGLFGALAAFWWRQLGGADPLLRALGTSGVLMVAGVVVRNSTNDFFQRDLSLLFWSITGILLGVASARTRQAADPT